MNWAKKTQTGWANEIAQGNFDITGTLKFNSGQKISPKKAQALLRAFWHKVDRIFFGNAADKGVGVNRWCFLELGEFEENTHLHFVAEAPIDLDLTCAILNQLWSDFHHDTAALKFNWITPIENKVRTARYITKEARNQRDEITGLMCAHKNADGISYSTFDKAAQQRRIDSRIGVGKLDEALAVVESHIAQTRASVSKPH